jgi:hypothetical protein
VEAGRAPYLTADICSEMASDSIRSELKNIPWITKNGVQIARGECAPISGSGGQTVSFPGKVGKGDDRSKYVDSPLKRHVLAALETLRQNVEMVDATGLEPVIRVLTSIDVSIRGR